jgi:hypothetical protein
VPEERICAQFGIPPMVVGLGSGLERSTFSNMREAREAVYESCLVPIWRVMSQQLTNTFLPMFGEDPREIRLHFDTTKIQALQEDDFQKHDKIRNDYEKGIITRAEARMQLGFNYENDQKAFEKDNLFVEQLPKLIDEERINEDESVKSITAEERANVAEEDFAGPGRTYPIRNQQDVHNAARLIGHAKDPESVKNKIIEIAKRKGLDLPKSWESSK